jgi:prepilin-type N-terminal cleavage/methylation domain-containing protein
MKQAFSLIELSIVLVILGLLTGGILAGQSLIRAAELRSISADYTRYSTATYSFRDKYFGIPGDLTNAVRFWGVRPGATTGNESSCHTLIFIYTGTCNGDGNGALVNTVNEAVCPERFLFWQHLALAGLIEGKYSGATTNTSTCAMLGGQNVPNAKLNTTWSVSWGLPVNGGSDPEFFERTPPTANFMRIGYVLTAAEVWNIDQKMDDGKPALGKVFINKRTSSWMPNCATSDAVTAEYDLTATTKNCAPLLSI